MVTVNELKEFMSKFIEIHGQNDNQNLLDIKEHQKYLDGFIGVPIKELKEEYLSYYTRFNEINKELKENYGDDKERQRKILEQMNKINIDEYYPLKFISNINYWSIILCGGGYFSYGLFLKDKEIEHKSDHKYVVRKKAGVRQVIKDKGKKIISMGAH